MVENEKNNYLISMENNLVNKEIIDINDETFKKSYSKTISKVSGMIDVSPTILNMLGLEQNYALGEDLFSNFEKENIVVFPNGNFITDTVYYNDSKNEYKILKNVPIGVNYIRNCKKYTEELLDISNEIAVYNYFEEILSDDKYIDETRIGEK